MREPNRSEYLHVIFDNLPVGVLVADDEGVYLDANTAACKLLGRSCEELIGMHVTEIVAPDRKSDAEMQWKGFLKHGAQAGIFEIALPDGGTRKIHFQAMAGCIPGVHCSFITFEPELEVRRRGPDDLLTICPWTHRVLFEGAWLSFEEYLQKAHGVLVTHGISPDAFPALDS